MSHNAIENDKKQRQLALDASKSFIVQAPAGSGKTELLIQRFLTLLLHVQSPEEILAITFTKKAANEMRLRVINALKMAELESEPESLHAKQTWRLAKQVLKRDTELSWHLLSNPNQFRIQTIDALCAFITKQLPLLSHFGSQPDISENPAILYREAVQEVLMHVEENFEWSQAISQLLLHLDNDFNKLHDLLVSLLAKRDQWLPYIHFNTSVDDINKALENHIRMVITDSLHALRVLFSKDETQELLAIANFAANNLSTDNHQLSDLPDTSAEDKHLWLRLAELLLTSTHTWRKRFDEKMGFPALAGLKNASEKALHKEYRERLKNLIDSFNHRDDLHSALCELFSLPEPRYQPLQWEILQALLKVLKIVAAQLRIVFQQHGMIDFIENAQAALLALGNDEHPTDLSLALDYRIQHILVDEFQDTSYTQYQLLEKLVMGWQADDGRTLFVVGDPMQSIYRFREAEVGLFIRLGKNGIAQIKLTPLTLSMNFRSAAPIVEWNNHHFTRIFPTFTDISAGAVSFSPSVAQKVSDTNEDIPSVTIQGSDKSFENLQTDAIITTIQTIKQNHPNENIAILVRSRTHLRTIIPALKNAEIPYRAVDIDPLASRQCIQDVLSLTAALLHPADRVAWLAILRAPWCGLSLADLFVIAGDDAYAPIMEKLANVEIIERLSSDGRERLARVYPVLKSSMAERERKNIREWIEHTWQLLGGPACLSDPIDMDDANAYFNLLNTFAEGQQTIHIEQLKEKIQRLFAATLHEDKTLQIMTIHSAKGLEFDNVILPHLERKMPHDDKPLLSWMERPLANDKMALLLAPIHATGASTDPMYDYIYRLHKIKTRYETDRLFYVAATRAKKRLNLFFSAETKEDGEIKLESGSFLEKLWPHIQQTGLFTQHSNEQNQLLNLKPEKLSKKITRLKNEWTNPLFTTQNTDIILHNRKDGFALPDNRPKLLGIVIHRIMQQLSHHGISWWEDKTTQLHEMYVQQQLNLLGMTPQHVRPYIVKVLHIISQVINDPRGQWILQPQREAQSEFPLSAVLDNQVINLVLDRTFVDDAGTRWIIDFKTAEMTNNNLDKFLQDQQKKYLPQMNKYADAMRLLDTRVIRMGLYFPALPAWIELNLTQNL